MADIKHSAWYTIEWRFLPLKALYFAFYAGSGCLLPFISVFMKQLGLTSIETGIIFGCMPFVSFFASPLFGMIADKTRKHKLVLITSAILSGLFYNLLLFVPVRSNVSAESLPVRATLRCGQHQLYLYDNFGATKSANLSQTQNDCNYGRGIESLLNQTVTNENDPQSQTCQFKCKTTSLPIYSSCLEDLNGMVGCEKNKDNLNITKANKTLQLLIDRSDLTAINDNQSSNHQDTCQGYFVNKFKSDFRYYTNLYCDNETFYDCEIRCGNKSQPSCQPKEDHNPTTFYLYFVFYLFATLFNVPMVSMVDGVAYSMLGEERRTDWGKQRMWGTFSFIIIAPISSYIMDRLKTSHTEANYQWSFYIFLGCNIVVAIITSFMQFTKEAKSGRFLENVTKLFRYPEIVVFLILNMFLGIFKILLEVFLFWHLKDLHSPQVVLGLAVMANCIPEAIMLGQAGRIIKKIGCASCLYIAIFAFALRFFAYSLLTNPWYVLMIEPLNAFTFALMYAAATAYASEIAPPGMTTTMQGIRGGFHSGLGKGIGGLMSGKLFDRSGLGGAMTFRVYSVACVAVLVVYATIQITCFRKNTNNRGEAVDMPKDHAYSKLLTEDMSSDSDTLYEEESPRQVTSQV